MLIFSILEIRLTISMRFTLSIESRPWSAIFGSGCAGVVAGFGRARAWPLWLLPVAPAAAAARLPLLHDLLDRFRRSLRQQRRNHGAGDRE